MNIDLKCTQLALKMKNLVVLDFQFPDMAFPEFRSKYEERYWHLPNRENSAIAIASGLASMGKVVLVHVPDPKEFDLPDATLNVKVLKPSSECTWETFEQQVLAFGPALLLIPEDK